MAETLRAFFFFGEGSGERELGSGSGFRDLVQVQVQVQEHGAVLVVRLGDGRCAPSGERRSISAVMGQFDHDRLEVYRLALEVNALIAGLVPRGHSVLRDQLERAASSIALCIAEGAGRRAVKEKQHFYSIARGSATESAAVLDLLRARKIIEQRIYDETRSCLLRIVRMLSRLSNPPPLVITPNEIATASPDGTTTTARSPDEPPPPPRAPEPEPAQDP